MRHNQPVTLAKLLDSHALTRSRQRHGLTREHEAVWQSVVDVSLRSGCRLHGLREDTLTLAVDSATQASQLRYLQRIILQQLQVHPAFSQVQKLRIVVMPRAVQPTRKAVNPLPRLSRTTATHLQQIADLLEDPELSERLQRLARHVQR